MPTGSRPSQRRPLPARRPPTGASEITRRPQPTVETRDGSHVRSGVPVAWHSWVAIAVAVACGLPWIALRATTSVDALPPLEMALLTGVGIVGAAFLLSWGAEVFQLDVSQAFAIAVLSLIAVLPEYAVDAVFAWRGASDATQASYAVANMTGSNRLIIGLGWVSVVVVSWLRSRNRPLSQATGHGGQPARDLAEGTVRLEKEQVIEIVVLAMASAYALVIPLKGRIDLVDAGVLIALFGVYAWATARTPSSDVHLEGPAATVGALTTRMRRSVMAGMFVYAVAVIFLSAHYFAEGLVATGTSFGYDEFLLVQWLAPLASESPEFLIALLFAWRGAAVAGLRTLISSTVNQWTLLVGTLGIVFRVGQLFSVDPISGSGLPLDGRQIEEMLLTSAFSLFALTLIANYDLTIREALALGGVFVFQLVGAQLAPDRTLFQNSVIAALFASAVLMIASSPSRRSGLLAAPARVLSSLGLQR